jgi:hypothetical protein
MKIYKKYLFIVIGLFVIFLIGARYGKNEVKHIIGSYRIDKDSYYVLEDTYKGILKTEPNDKVLNYIFYRIIYYKELGCDVKKLEEYYYVISNKRKEKGR